MTSRQSLLHQFSKQTRRVRVWLTCFVTLLLIDAGIRLTDRFLATSNSWWDLTALVDWWTPILFQLMAGMVVLQVFAEDRHDTGEAHYWRSLPIAPRTIWWGNVLFVCCWIIMLPLGIRMVWQGFLGYDNLIVWMSLEWIVLQLIAATICALLGVLCPRGRQLGPGILATIGITFLYGLAWWMPFVSRLRPFPYLATFVLLVSAAIGIAALPTMSMAYRGISFHHCWRRFAAWVAVIVPLLFLLFQPHGWLRQPWNAQETADSTLHDSFQTLALVPREIPNFSPSITGRDVRLPVGILATGIPDDGTIRLFKWPGRAILPNGQALDDPKHLIPRRRHRLPLGTQDLASLFPDLTFIHPSREGLEDLWEVWARFSEEDAEILARHKSGRYEGSFLLYQYHPKIIARIPFQANSIWRDSEGRAVRVESQETITFCYPAAYLREETHSPKHQRAFLKGQATDTHLFVLVNGRKNEALLLRSERSSLWPFVWPPYSGVVRHRLKLQGANRERLASLVDETWLADAKLVIVDTGLVGRTKMTFSLPKVDFHLP